MDKLTSIESLTAQDKALLLKIWRAVRAVDFGSVHLTINDSRVVQIEKTEKIRVKPSQDCVCS